MSFLHVSAVYVLFLAFIFLLCFFPFSRNLFLADFFIFIFFFPFIHFTSYYFLSFSYKQKNFSITFSAVSHIPLVFADEERTLHKTVIQHSRELSLEPFGLGHSLL